MRLRDRILVTGGAGFIGSELVAQLCAVNRHVVVVDNLATGLVENLAGLPVTLIPGDVRDPGHWRYLLEETSTVYHLACLGVRHSIHSPVENHDVNAGGTLAVLEAALRSGVERFVHVSSSEVYGTAVRIPMTEDHPTNPETPYGAAKLAGEAYARAYHRTYGLPVAIVRPFNTFGPRCHHEGASGEVIPRFLLRALTGRPLIVFGDGEQTRDFTWVSDTARGIIAAGEVAGAVGRTLNLGSGREVSLLTLALLIAGEHAEIVHEPERPGDVRRLIADASGARRMLGFAPRVGLEDGLAQLRDWYVQQRTPPEKLLAAEVVRNWLIQ